MKRSVLLALGFTVVVAAPARRAQALCDLPSAIRCGETTESTLTFGDCVAQDGAYVKSYGFEADHDLVLRAMVFAGAADQDVRVSIVEGDDAQPLAQSHGAGGASVAHFIRKGQLILISVAGTKPATSASYHLRVTCEAADAHGCAAVGTASCGTHVSGTISGTDCEEVRAPQDRYELPLSAGQTVEISASAGFPLILEVGRRDVDGVYTGIVRSGESASTLTFTADETATYDVRIGAAWEFWGGAYDFDVSCAGDAPVRRRGVRH